MSELTELGIVIVVFVVAVAAYCIGRAHGISVGIAGMEGKVEKAEDAWQELNQWLRDVEDRLSNLEAELPLGTGDDEDDDESWRG